MNAATWTARYRRWNEQMQQVAVLIDRIGVLPNLDLIEALGGEAAALAHAAAGLITGTMPPEGLDAHHAPDDHHIGGDAAFDVVVDSSLNIVLIHPRGRVAVSDVSALIVGLADAYDWRNDTEGRLDAAAGRPRTEYPPLPDLRPL